MSTEQLVDEIRALPPEAQREAQDFVAFLRDRYQAVTRGRRSASAPLADEPFVGMWKERLDLADSSSWVRQVRSQQWKRRGA